MHTIPCHRCESPFERKRRGPVAHHCPPCRSALQRERNRERMALRRLEIDIALGRMPEEVSVAAQDLAYETELFAADRLPTQADRMPPGSKSPLGSDDGRSTYFTTLAGELDTKAFAAARHTCDDETGDYAHHTQDDCGQCFWDNHPHWCLDL